MNRCGKIVGQGPHRRISEFVKMHVEGPARATDEVSSSDGPERVGLLGGRIDDTADDSRANAYGFGSGALVFPARGVGRGCW